MLNILMSTKFDRGTYGHVVIGKEGGRAVFGAFRNMQRTGFVNMTEQLTH